MEAIVQIRGPAIGSNAAAASLKSLEGLASCRTDDRAYRDRNAAQRCDPFHPFGGGAWS
jgi:hypothetical protein